MQWHGLSSDATVREGARRLDSFLDSRTPAGEPLRTVLLVLGEDEVFPVDVARNTLDSSSSPGGTVHHQHGLGTTISCKPLDLVDDDGVPFRRMVESFFCTSSLSLSFCLSGLSHYLTRLYLCSAFWILTPLSPVHGSNPTLR